MSNSDPSQSSTNRANSGDAEFARLQSLLKRCSPATLEAAVAFSRTGDKSHLRPIVVGVIERFVERDLRPKLADADDNIRLIEDLGVDSLTMMEIVVMAEDVLQISVSNEELMKLRTLGEIRDFIAAKVDAPAAAAQLTPAVSPS